MFSITNIVIIIIIIINIIKININININISNNNTNNASMLQELGWRSLEQRRVDSRLTLLFKIAHGLAPTCHSDQLRLPK